MNSMNTEPSDDFEKRLASLSIVEPSDEYRNLIAAIDEVPKSHLATNRKSLLGYSIAFGLVFAAVIGVGITTRDEYIPHEGQYISESTSINDLSPVVTGSSLEQPYLLGTHYTEPEISRLLGEQPFSDIKVFFSYPCFPCYEFNEILEEWRDVDPLELEVMYVPATWSEELRHYAQVFYTAENLGVLEQAHQQLFEALHQEGLVLEELPSLIRFFSSLGISPQRFLSVFNSEATLSRVRETEQTNQEYMIRSAPALVVDCRYLITPNSEVGQREMLEVAQYLIDNRQVEGNKLC